METNVQFLGDTIKYLYGPSFQGGNAFPHAGDFTGFSLALSDILIRIYALDPENYAVNEAHVKEEFEKISLAAVSTAERMGDMMRALNNLKQTVADLELQMGIINTPQHVIQEEPDIEELLA